MSISAPPSYWYYTALATHTRALEMDSDRHFDSKFTGRLQMVRVELPESPKGESIISTRIGTVCFERDHLLGSIDSVMARFSSELKERRPAKVSLITTARNGPLRFAAISIYLLYPRADDGVPAHYILEAGTADGKAMALYYGPFVGGTIQVKTDYLPTPFSSAENLYNGGFSMHGDEPSHLIVRAKTLTDSAPYLNVFVAFTRISEDDVDQPQKNAASVLVEAGSRVGALASAMGLSQRVGFLERLLGYILWPWLTWEVNPSACYAPHCKEEAEARQDPDKPMVVL